MAAPAGDVAAGRATFRAGCASCHQVGPSARSGFGPQLNHLIGRRAGSLADYAYSPAMKGSTLVWNEQNLAAFIRQPERVVPGTKMRFFALGYDERRIANLLAYLRSEPGEAQQPARP
ncbi:c-type cytochrome [Roseateles sp. DAIF2]|uniref:c-type cytochrome n=1 Tax=Roseateles sp. DAIF2 TaxID=2714952 RepID=UPI0018A29407|nr:c-type cytochrome [Roseateles sp. DAIF2]QPF75592.1 c-type cytochrome [Roseateles sp. DAIF2]